MEKFLTFIDDFYHIAPDFLVHAPFYDGRNITPFAHLNPHLDYDITHCEGQNIALFATHDKTESLGLIATCIKANPKTLTIIWLNEWGGKGLNKHLDRLGLGAHFEIKAHARLAHITDFTPLNKIINQEFEDHAASNFIKNTKFKTQAGLFSWRNIDPASTLLKDHLPTDLSGYGADFGAGWGYLSDAILTREAVQKLDAIEVDKRGIDSINANFNDPKMNPIWADITHFKNDVLYDFIVMNPPFHEQGSENRALGQMFIESAAVNLKKGGHLYMVANRHLPYEFALKKLYKSFHISIDKNGFKIIVAKK